MSFSLGLKPIFHCDAKLLALGTFASANAKDRTFALPNAKNTNMLVSLALGDASFLRWPCTYIGGVGSSGVGHVYFHVVCVSFSALATRKLADAKADSSGIWA